MKDQRSRRLEKTYGYTADEVDAMFASQNGACKICGRPPKNIRLSVEHDHRFSRPHLTFVHKVNQYEVSAETRAGTFVFLVPTDDKKIARQQVLKALKRLSVRGGCCFRCNKGLQAYSDRPERLESAAQYLRDYEKRLLEATHNPIDLSDGTVRHRPSREHLEQQNLDDPQLSSPTD